MALTGTFERAHKSFYFLPPGSFILRRRGPVSNAKNRTGFAAPLSCLLGLSLGPGIFVAGALALTVNIWLERPGRSSIGLLLILAGLPFYRWWSTSGSARSDAMKSLSGAKKEKCTKRPPAKRVAPGAKTHPKPHGEKMPLSQYGGARLWADH